MWGARRISLNKLLLNRLCIIRISFIFRWRRLKLITLKKFVLATILEIFGLKKKSSRTTTQLSGSSLKYSSWTVKSLFKNWIEGKLLKSDFSSVCTNTGISEKNKKNLNWVIKLKVSFCRKLPVLKCSIIKCINVDLPDPLSAKTMKTLL